MNPADPIILVAYLLCIAYFLLKIVDSFNDEFTIKADEDAIKQQLTGAGLQDVIGISFRFDRRYEFSALKQLSINISNKSGDAPAEKDKVTKYALYIDWDCSTLTDLEKRSRRVTRIIPGTTLDLFQSQAFSTVAPNTTLKETITAEDLLQRKGERKSDKLDVASPLNLEVEITKPLIDLKPARPAGDLKKKLEKFKKQEVTLDFSLELACRVASPSHSLGGDRVYILCPFILTKLPWTSGLPWNPK